MQVGVVLAGLIGLWALYGVTVAAVGAVGAVRRRDDGTADRRARAIYGQHGRS